MSLEPTHFVAIIVAVVTGIGGYLTARRNTKPLERGEETKKVATLLSSYDAFADRLQGELERVRKDCDGQIAAMRRQHHREREQWQAEKNELNERIDELEAQVVALIERLQRDPHTRTRDTDS